MDVLLTSYTLLPFVVSDERISDESKRASWTHLNVSDWSLNSLAQQKLVWLVVMRIAVLNLLSLAQCQPANADLNLAAGDMMHWTFESWTIQCDCIKYNKYYSAIFLSFGSYFQNPLGSKFSLWIGMTPLLVKLLWNCNLSS